MTTKLILSILGIVIAIVTAQWMYAVMSAIMLVEPMPGTAVKLFDGGWFVVMLFYSIVISWTFYELDKLRRK